MKDFSAEQKFAIARMLNMGKSHIEIAKVMGVNPLKISSVALKGMSASPDQVYQCPSPTAALTEGILLGFTKHEAQVLWHPKSLPNAHLMMVGESGFGKTYGLTAITSELSVKYGFPIFIIDYSNSYSPDKFPLPLKIRNRIREIHIGSEGLQLNPLEIREDDIWGPQSVALRIEGTFSRIYNIGVKQKAVFRQAVIDTFERNNIFADENSSWDSKPPHLFDVYKRLGEIAEDFEHPQRSNAGSLHAHVSDFFIRDVFCPNGLRFKWEKTTNDGQVLILQLRGIQGRTQKVITEFLLWDLYSFLVSRGESPLTCFVVLDEAHNLSFAQDSPIDKILREARKFGLGAIIASQQPDDFSDVAFSNTHTKVCFQISAERGAFIKKLAAKSRMEEDLIRGNLTSLSKTHAFIISQNEGQFCRIASLEERNL